MAYCQTCQMQFSPSVGCRCGQSSEEMTFSPGTLDRLEQLGFLTRPVDKNGCPTGECVLDFPEPDAEDPHVPSSFQAALAEEGNVLIGTHNDGDDNETPIYAPPNTNTQNTVSSEDNSVSITPTPNEDGTTNYDFSFTPTVDTNDYGDLITGIDQAFIDANGPNYADGTAMTVGDNVAVDVDGDILCFAPKGAVTTDSDSNIFTVDQAFIDDNGPDYFNGRPMEIDDTAIVTDGGQVMCFAPKVANTDTDSTTVQVDQAFIDANGNEGTNGQTVQIGDWVQVNDDGTWFCIPNKAQATGSDSQTGFVVDQAWLDDNPDAVDIFGAPLPLGANVQVHTAADDTVTYHCVPPKGARLYANAGFTAASPPDPATYFGFTDEDTDEHYFCTTNQNGDPIFTKDAPEIAECCALGDTWDDDGTEVTVSANPATWPQDFAGGQLGKIVTSADGLTVLGFQIYDPVEDTFTGKVLGGSSAQCWTVACDPECDASDPLAPNVFDQIVVDTTGSVTPAGGTLQATLADGSSVADANGLITIPEATLAAQANRKMLVGPVDGDGARLCAPVCLTAPICPIPAAELALAAGFQSECVAQLDPVGSYHDPIKPFYQVTAAAGPLTPVTYDMLGFEVTNNDREPMKLHFGLGASGQTQLEGGLDNTVPVGYNSMHVAFAALLGDTVLVDGAPSVFQRTPVVGGGATHFMGGFNDRWRVIAGGQYGLTDYAGGVTIRREDDDIDVSDFVETGNFNRSQTAYQNAREYKNDFLHLDAGETKTVVFNRYTWAQGSMRPNTDYLAAADPFADFHRVNADNWHSAQLAPTDAAFDINGSNWVRTHMGMRYALCMDPADSNKLAPTVDPVTVTWADAVAAAGL